MKKFPMLLLALGTGLSMFSSCRSTKTPQAQTAGQTETSTCHQTIKYYSEKIRMAGGQEEHFNTEITVNPLSRLITVSSEPPDQEKLTYTIVIERIDCNFKTDNIVGHALYHGYTNLKDGTTIKTILKLEAINGVLIFSQANPEDKGDFVIIVSKWEIVKE